MSWILQIWILQIFPACELLYSSIDYALKPEWFPCLAAELVSFLYKCYSMIFLTFYQFSCWGESQLCICSYLYPLFMELCVLSSFFTQNLISLFSHGNVYWFVSLCFDCAETNIFSAWLQLEHKLNYQLLFVHSLPLFLTVIENKTHLL